MAGASAAQQSFGGQSKVCRASGDPGGPRRCSGDARLRYQRAAADRAAAQRSEQAAHRAWGIEPVKWFGHTRPPDPVVEELATEVVMATRPAGVLPFIPAGDPVRLAEWLAREVPAGEFDPVRDWAGVCEHASLLMEIEGWDLSTYLSCAEGLRGRRLRGARLYAMAFAAAAGRRGVERIPVYRALSRPMRPEQGLRCVSWHPHAHLADARYLYRSAVLPSDVVGVSVGAELHPIVSVRSDLRWERFDSAAGDVRSRDCSR